MPEHKTSCLILTHPDCLTHDTGPMHPESMGRLKSILAALEGYDVREAPAATREQLLLVHTHDYIDAVEESAPTGSGFAYLDPDTVMSPGSMNAAFRAAGSGIAAVDAAMKGKAKSIFCAVRPPGHHALPDRAMGFCLFNNIAIAARHAMKEYGIRRIAIVDFDVHHGNGTEAMFEADPRVLYVSTHEYPHWPGTGAASDTGAGNILNVPLPHGTAGAAYRKAFAAKVMPALHEHKPELLFASAGFDAHASDPLAGLALMEDDYRWIGAQLKEIADAYAGGKIISMLEGGYDLEALAASTVAYLEGLR